MVRVRYNEGLLCHLVINSSRGMRMPTPVRSQMVAVILLSLIVVAGTVIHASIPTEHRPGTDIYYNWVEGRNILSGQNPYARILSSDMRVNKKYPTYFPLIYFLSTVSQKLG